MGLNNAKPGGGSEATEIFTELAKHGSTVVMRIVSQDGQRTGQQDKTYDVVTAHVLVIDGPHQWDFHKNLVITNAGITSSLVREPVGDDIAATIGTYKSFGKSNPAANECTPEKFAEVKTLFADKDPFTHYLGSGVRNGSSATPEPAAVPARKKAPWE